MSARARIPTRPGLAARCPAWLRATAEALLWAGLLLGLGGWMDGAAASPAVTAASFFALHSRPYVAARCRGGAPR